MKPIKAFNPCEVCPGREALKDCGSTVRSDFGNAVSEGRRLYTPYILNTPDRLGNKVIELAANNDVSEYVEEVQGCLEERLTGRCGKYYFDGSELIRSELL